MRREKIHLHPDEWTGVDSDSHRIKAANDASWDCELICSSDEKRQAWTKGVIIGNIAESAWGRKGHWTVGNETEPL